MGFRAVVVRERLVCFELFLDLLLLALFEVDLRREDVPPRVVLRAVLRLVLSFLRLVVLAVGDLRREDAPPRVVLRGVLRLVAPFLRVVVFFLAIAQMFTL